MIVTFLSRSFFILTSVSIILHLYCLNPSHPLPFLQGLRHTFFEN